MLASAYLGDLGGLSAHRSLVLLDLRGTGESAVPADPASYRCDRLVDDIEALRAHLGRDRVDLLGHSAGGGLAMLYAVRHPDRIGRLALVDPSPRAVGLEITDSDRRQVAELRRGEAWFPDAFAAFERIWSGDATAADWTAIAPFTYGRWDAVSQAHLAQQASQKNADAAAVYYSAGALAPQATRSALARLRARVLLGAGVEVGRVDHPDDERPGLLGIPAPVAAPGGLRPDAAGHDRERPDREAEGGGLEGQVVELLGGGQQGQDATGRGGRGRRPLVGVGLLHRNARWATGARCAGFPRRSFVAPQSSRRAPVAHLAGLGRVAGDHLGDLDPVGGAGAAGHQRRPPRGRAALRPLGDQVQGAEHGGEAERAGADDGRDHVHLDPAGVERGHQRPGGHP